jgi:hypothetical protein
MAKILKLFMILSQVQYPNTTVVPDKRRYGSARKTTPDCCKLQLLNFNVEHAQDEYWNGLANPAGSGPGWNHTGLAAQQELGLWPRGHHRFHTAGVVDPVRYGQDLILAGPGMFCW